MRWDNPGMRGAGGGDARSGLLRDDEPRLFLGDEEATPGTRIQWRGLFAWHMVAALVPLASLVYVAARTIDDPCDGREDLKPQCERDYYWILILLTKLSVWELAVAGGYFAYAARCDRSAGQEATYLGAVDSQQASYGSTDDAGDEKRAAAPLYPHSCCGWRFHLCRVDSYTERMLRQRDHLFSLAWPISIFVVVGYWTLLFPCTPNLQLTGGCEVQEAALASPWDVVQTALQHAFSAAMLQVELFIVHHRFQGVLLDMFLLVLFVGLYAGTNAIVRVTSQVWPYPSVQADLSPQGALLLYGGAGGCLLVLCVVFRMFNGWLWRARILREIEHARLMTVHRETSQQRHGGW